MMKKSAVLMLSVAACSGVACSLVTVPVKVAGDIVETTIKTTGDVISAPFSSRGEKDKNGNKETAAKDTKTATPEDSPASSEKDAPAE
jgi:hypothetical protein